MIDLANPRCPSCGSGRIVIFGGNTSELRCHDCAYHAELEEPAFYWSTSPSNSLLGSDIQIPAVEVDIERVPEPVAQRHHQLWTAATNWDVEALISGIENGADVLADLEENSRSFVDRAPWELEPVDDEEITVVRFDTKTENQFVFGFAAFLGREPGRDGMRGLLEWSLRFDATRSVVIGQAFDVRLYFS